MRNRMTPGIVGPDAPYLFDDDCVRCGCGGTETGINVVGTPEVIAEALTLAEVPKDAARHSAANSLLGVTGALCDPEILEAVLNGDEVHCRIPLCQKCASHTPFEVAQLYPEMHTAAELAMLS